MGIADKPCKFVGCDGNSERTLIFDVGGEKIQFDICQRHYEIIEGSGPDLSNYSIFDNRGETTKSKQEKTNAIEA